MAVHSRSRGGYPTLNPPPPRPVLILFPARRRVPHPPRPKRPSWETTKFTIGNMWLGHFWCTNFWVPDPPPPLSNTSLPPPPPSQRALHCLLLCRAAFFRKRMQDRIDYFTAERTPPASARTQARAWGKEWLARRVGTEHLPKVDYRAMIEEQAAMNAEMDKVHQRYQELLAKCLETVEEDLAKHANVGEYRDAGEYRCVGPGEGGGGGG